MSESITEATATEPLITADEVQILNVARTVLLGVNSRASAAALRVDAGSDGYRLGRLADATAQAQGSLFLALSVARSYCGVQMTDAELNNDPPQELTLAKPKPKSHRITAQSKGESNGVG